jgi:redox-sensitive bicupin YhaK (pirin superfamily)
MSVPRRINKIMKSVPTIEGAGVHLKRAFGYYQVPQLDPFLLLDDFHSDREGDYIQGFPWHPHRGIETITYVLHGRVEHGDSMGNRGTINSGDVQWMTAGSGIIHQEMPKGTGGLMWGFQLWANLPAAQKMMDPRYQEVKREQIPEVDLGGGVKVSVICGEVEGVKGPVRNIVIDPEYLEVSVPAGAGFTHPVRKGYTVFAYVIGGAGFFDDNRDCNGYDTETMSYFDISRDCLLTKETVVLYGDGEEVRVTAAEGPVRFLLVSGKPLGEPVAWQGPIVMNTREELRAAFREYQDGTFIKKGNDRHPARTTPA